MLVSSVLAVCGGVCSVSALLPPDDGDNGGRQRSRQRAADSLPVE